MKAKNSKEGLEEDGRNNVQEGHIEKMRLVIIYKIRVYGNTRI
jgi:hypothetical protein